MQKERMWKEYASHRMDIIERFQQMATSMKEYADNKDLIVRSSDVTTG